MCNDALTPTQRRIAEVILDDPSLITFGTVSDLADQVGTSRASIVRFATKLGFDGYSELQQHARTEFTKVATSPSQRLRHQDAAVAPLQRMVEDAVRDVFVALDAALLTSMAEPIVTAECVWILSGETSMAGAHALHSGLSMIRPNVHLVDAHASGRELCSASKNDVAVVIDFSRYRTNAVIGARTLAELHVPIVAITDGALSPLASLTNNRCDLNIPAVGPFDSSIPAVLASEMLVSQVVHLLGNVAKQRIDKLESLWQKMSTFLEYSPPTKVLK
jgi:DNA-binding MurR/RpiR family transcriptional regulator